MTSLGLQFRLAPSVPLSDLEKDQMQQAIRQLTVSAGGVMGRYSDPFKWMADRVFSGTRTVQTLKRHFCQQYLDACASVPAPYAIQFAGGDEEEDEEEQGDE
eukprot:NODE_3233_length_1019_cov_36.539175_g2973_i0.p5 GENE.NODE_3233_length_1019_cov_36.539175_g2973_i0~~NODE_3233_length_1019_cov_36.539175_g2973_i0.p5  ORF type:complete len:102 (-),score=19.61 NODE_3233_length_1019_cov_36.539175_g2973_i0:83-388(-)